MRRRTGISVSASAFARAKSHARKVGLSVSELVELAVAEIPDPRADVAKAAAYAEREGWIGP